MEGERGEQPQRFPVPMTAPSRALAERLAMYAKARLVSGMSTYPVCFDAEEFDLLAAALLREPLMEREWLARALLKVMPLRYAISDDDYDEAETLRDADALLARLNEGRDSK